MTYTSHARCIIYIIPLSLSHAGGRGLLARQSPCGTLVPGLLGTAGKEPGVLSCLCTSLLSPLPLHGHEMAFALQSYRSDEALDLWGFVALWLALFEWEGPTNDVLSHVILLKPREEGEGERGKEK